MKIKKFTEVLAVAGVMLVSGASQHAYGQAEKIGNGGEGYEAEFSGFKSEIMTWVNKTGLKDLSLGSINGEALVKTLNTQEVHVSFVDQDLMVGTKKRTCKNYPEKSLIECQKTAWSNETTQTKYTLVFHELLGLAKAETNIGEESDYRISSQIRDYIDAKTVYSLSPVRVGENEQMIVRCYTGNAVGEYFLQRHHEASITIFPDGTLFARKTKWPRGYTGERRCTNQDCTKSRYTGSYYFFQIFGEKAKTYENLESKVSLNEWSTLDQFSQVVLMNGEERRLSLRMPSRNNYQKCTPGRELGSYECSTKMGTLTESFFKDEYKMAKKVIEYSCQWEKVSEDQILQKIANEREALLVK